MASGQRKSLWFRHHTQVWEVVGLPYGGAQPAGRALALARWNFVLILRSDRLNRGFQFQKRGQVLISVHSETLSVDGIRATNEGDHREDPKIIAF